MAQKRESNIHGENEKVSGVGIGDKRRRRRSRRIEKGYVFVQHNLLGHDGERDDGHNQSAMAETGSGMMAVTTLATDTWSESSRVWGCETERW